MQRQSQAGMAMVLAIIVILLLGAVIVPLAGVARQYRIDTWMAAENERSIALAEAGIAAALCEVMNEVDFNRTPSGNTGIGNVADFVGDGQFAVTIEPAYAGMDGAPYEITAIGTQGEYEIGIRVAIEANGISAQQANIYSWWMGYPGAVFSNADLYLSGPRDAYSYDSTDGTSTETDQGHIFSNGDIHIGYNSSMEVFGDVTPGPGGSVTMHGLPFTEIHGSTTPSSQELNPPQPEIPDNPYSIPANPYTIPAIPGANDNATLDPTYYDSVANSLIIPDWDDVTFPGGTYVLDDIYFGGAGTQIIFSGDTTIYVPATKLFEISTGEYIVNGNLTIVTYGATSMPSGWADWDINGDFNLHVASTGSFTTAGTDDYFIEGNITVNSEGPVSFGDDEIVQDGVTGDAEFYISSTGSLSFADWCDFTCPGALDIVSDGPVYFGGAGTDISAAGDTSYYIDSNGSVDFGTGGDINSGGKMLIVSKGPINYTSWSNVNVGTDMEIYLDPGASLTYGSVSDLTMNGNFKIISHDAPIDFGTGSDIEFTSSDSYFDIYTTSTINGGAWNTMAAGDSSPHNLRWVTTSTSNDAIKIGGPRDFYGQIYAPNGQVTIDSGSDVVGAIVADRMSQDSWNRFIFDVSLKGEWEQYETEGVGETTTEGEVRGEGELPFLITSVSTFHP